MDKVDVLGLTLGGALLFAAATVSLSHSSLTVTS